MCNPCDIFWQEVINNKFIRKRKNKKFLFMESKHEIEFDIQMYKSFLWIIPLWTLQILMFYTEMGFSGEDSFGEKVWKLSLRLVRSFCLEKFWPSSPIPSHEILIKFDWNTQFLLIKSFETEIYFNIWLVLGSTTINFQFNSNIWKSLHYVVMLKKCLVLFMFRDYLVH